ncbi:Calcineurin subunit B [Venturia nashicola]|nr:Calcineurin subunit B [Venturia nashicola]
MDHPSPVSLGTPMSSQCEERGLSLGWSFMAESSTHLSYPSSIASFQSSHEPQTPPPYAMHVDFTVNENGSCENFAIPSSTKPPYHNSPLAQTSTMTDAFESQPEPDWAYIHRSSETTMHRLPFYGNEAILPTTTNPTLGAGIDQATGFEQQPMSYPSWTSQQPLAVYPAAESLDWQQPMRSPGSTIVPSSVVRDQIHFHGYQECTREFYGLSQFDIDVHYKSEPSLSEQGDGTWTPNSGMMTPDFRIKKGSKPSTKDRKSTSGKRRSKITKPTQERRVFNNEYQPQQSRNGKKGICNLVTDDNQICTKVFDRDEHLKRHRLTHSSERPFACPLHLRPQYKCSKGLGRRDNWRDHLRTHLSDTMAGRNDRISFELMFELLREQEQPQEAEKTINMLLKWKATGGHLKSTSTAARGTRVA